MGDFHWSNESTGFLAGHTANCSDQLNTWGAALQGTATLTCAESSAQRSVESKP
jgi:hypothetical protein